jgi:hypothetical protein
MHHLLHWLSSHIGSDLARDAASLASSQEARASSSIDAAEVSKFSALSDGWWSDEMNGPFSALHAMNSVRVPLLRRALAPLVLRRLGAAGADSGAAAPEPAPLRNAHSRRRVRRGHI